MKVCEPHDDTAEIPVRSRRFKAWLWGVLWAGARSFRFALSVRKNEAEGESPGSDVTDTLAQVIAELDLLNRSTEQDFLRIGGQLSDFIESANQILTELAALVESHAESYGRLAAEALSNALDRSIEMQARYAERGDALASMREKARHLKQTLSGFAGTIAIIRTLGVLTLIETARLGAAGTEFGSLAEDVKLLAESVQDRVENAVDATVLLFSPIEGAIRDIATLEAGQAEDLPAVIAGVLTSLASFQSFCVAQTASHDSSVLMSAQTEAILEAFKKLIVSIQFHDLTRQQVEHVIDVLRRLCSDSAGDGSSIPRYQPGVVQILAVQSAQLADAGGRFAASAASVTRNLDELARNVLEVASQSRTLARLSGQEKDSLFQQMDRGCNAGLASLNHCAIVESATRTASSGLGGTIGMMRESIEDIATIEIQMHRMALNASISAAHLGKQGDSIGVLAGTMQSQALESRARSESLVEALDQMSHSAALLSGTHSGEATMERGSLDGMRTAVSDLRSSSERDFAKIAQIVAHGARLHDELNATRDSFAVGVLFAASIDRARKLLKSVGEQQCESSSPSAGTDVAVSQLGSFADHYTMQAELDVHSSSVSVEAGVVLAELTAGQACALPEVVGKFEENVEFF